MPPVRVGILGASKIADRSTVPAMSRTDGVEVAGVAARNVARAREFADRHGTAVFDDYQAVIDAAEVDAVYIPLPNGLHARWALAALNAGKHVLVEKSLAGTLDDCLAILELARARDLVVVENFMCERHPQNVFVRDAVRAGEVGTIQHVDLTFGFPPFPPDDQRNSRELAGGALNDAGAYCIDMAAYYLGRWPTAVTASLSAHGADVDTVGAALLEYEGGTTASLAFGFQHDYRNHMRIWGSTGQIDVDRCFSIPADREPDVVVTKNTVGTRIELPAADQFALQIEYFRDRVAARDGGEELSRRERHARVMEAVRRSAATGHRVRIDFDETSGPQP